MAFQTTPFGWLLSLLSTPSETKNIYEDEPAAEISIKLYEK